MKPNKNGKMKRYHWSMKKFQFKAKDDKKQSKLIESKGGSKNG